MKLFILQFAICILQFAVLPLPLGAQATQPTTQPAVSPSNPPATQPVVLRLPVFNASGKALPGGAGAAVNFIYDQNLFAPGVDRTGNPDPAYVAAQIKALPGGRLTVIDHESVWLFPAQWNTVTAIQVRANIAECVRIAKLIKKLRPDLRPLAFFGCCIADDYDYVQCENTDVHRMVSDVANTAALKPIADVCDVIVVPVYDVQASGWQAHAYRQLMLGRTWGKRVYAAVSPGPNGVALAVPQFVADSQWAATFSDGLIVWDWDPANARTAWVQPLVAALKR